MSRFPGVRIAVSAALAGSLAACSITSTTTGPGTATTGTASSAPTATATTPPTTRQLALALLSPDEVNRVFESLGRPGGWEEQSGFEVPAVELCADAGTEAVDAQEILDWQAVVQMNQAVTWSVLQEAVLTIRGEDLTQLFDALAEGLTSCLGVPTESESLGTTLTQERYEVTTSADATFATRAEADGSLYARVLMHDRGVLVHLTVALPLPAEDEEADAREVVENLAETAVVTLRSRTGP